MKTMGLDGMCVGVIVSGVGEADIRRGLRENIPF